MAKHLERDLGLYATITVSIGAMVGSGLFVLPGLAAAKTGPSIIVAYVLAGLIVLPAALSKAEMATAMPDAGGTYLYIDRAMGPRMGTIAGLGAWFSLVFKSAFALVGLGAYLVLVVPVGGLGLKAMSLLLGAALVGINLVGAKQSGQLQAVIVTVVVGALLVFGADGVTYVNSARYHPFFTDGASGLLAATGFVFVSYAGVTKVASIAEEVANPDVNLPLGILLSVGIMIPLYALITFVVVGATTPAALHGSLTPMAEAASRIFGSVGVPIISILAVLALTSMANAGLLSSSRFPLAMSRDRLAPDVLATISDRFRTPTYALWITGALLLGLIAFVPVLELAKLASAFKILIFTFINGALIAFRESGLESYDPAFRAPGYPWVQLAGIGGGGLLLTQMGWLALGGAVGIIGMGLLWYRLYGRERTAREGAALDAIQRAIQQRALVRIDETFAIRETNVMITLDPSASPETERFLLAIGGSVAQKWDGAVAAVRMEEVPSQTSLSTAADAIASFDAAFEERVQHWGATHEVPVTAHEIVCHDAERAMRTFVDTQSIGLQVGGAVPGRWRFKLLGHDVDEYMRDVPCEHAFLDDAHAAPDAVDTVAVFTQRGPYGPLKVVVADAVAAHYGATLRFVTSVPGAASDDHRGRVKAFHDDLAERCSAPTTSVVHTAEPVHDTLHREAAQADIVVLGTVPRTRLQTFLMDDLSYDLATALDVPVLLVRPPIPRGPVVLPKIVERLAF
ncbi:amino acid permease [Salisaeta longa]|uniref:amino acid permease n=1 Tax=Salisaeta longa TaxID=503170 RepID=UPI0003B6B9B0|nr:amino acid permease [Salisaeta longa]